MIISNNTSATRGQVVSKVDIHIHTTCGLEFEVVDPVNGSLARLDWDEDHEEEGLAFVRRVIEKKGLTVDQVVWS